MARLSESKEEVLFSPELMQLRPVHALLDHPHLSRASQAKRMEVLGSREVGIFPNDLPEEWDEDPSRGGSVVMRSSLIRSVLVTATLLLFPALTPAAAQGAKTIDSYCSPSGDYCQYVIRNKGKIKFEMRQFPLRGKYTLCVKPPRETYTCKNFRWRRSGPILKSTVTFSRHFPSKKRGRYKVQWRSTDGYRIGKTLSFRKG